MKSGRLTVYQALLRVWKATGKHILSVSVPTDLMRKRPASSVNECEVYIREDELNEYILKRTEKDDGFKSSS